MNRRLLVWMGVGFFGLMGAIQQGASLFGQQAKKETAPMSRSELLKRFAGEFVEIAPGQTSRDGKIQFPTKFQMGSAANDSEKPAHEVTPKHSFAIAKYEVPQNLWQAVMGENPSRWKGPRNSVEMMSWHDSREFCRKITELLRTDNLLSNEEEIRLPTEAEWEYCCRAGTSTAYSFGDEATKPGDAGNQASALNEFAWHTGNAAGNDPPVGALKPNPWGLYDMHGYLWEFVEDAWHDNYTGAPADGQAWRDGAAPQRIVVRGGSWKSHFSKLTSSARSGETPSPNPRALTPDDKDDAIGLRCVRAKKR